MSSSGFSLPTFLSTIASVFEAAFYVDDPCPVLNDVVFGSTRRLREMPDTGKPIVIALCKLPVKSKGMMRLDDIKLPACILDLYGLKSGVDPYTNRGDLSLNVYLRAIVLVAKSELSSELRVRQLALDIAGLVTEQGRFGTLSGMSMVTSVGEVIAVESHYPHLVGWEVEWQHSIEIGAPDYSNPALRKFPEADSYYRDASGAVQDRELSGVTEIVSMGE